MAARKRAKPKPKPSKAAKIGRPSKLTPAVVRNITKAIAEGDTIEDACVVAGITTQTLRNWKAKARGGDEPKLLAFLSDLEYAQALARRARLKQIADGRMLNGEKDWKAVHAYVKLTDPHYSKQALTERALDNEMGARLESMEVHMSAEGIAEMWAAYAKVRGITLD